MNSRSSISTWPPLPSPLAGLPHDPKLDGVNLTPFLTGEKSPRRTNALFWRWGSQAAVLEMPCKLIKLGNRPPLLFDLTTPEGENIERNLAAQRPGDRRTAGATAASLGRGTSTAGTVRRQLRIQPPPGRTFYRASRHRRGATDQSGGRRRQRKPPTAAFKAGLLATAHSR